MIARSSSLKAAVENIQIRGRRNHKERNKQTQSLILKTYFEIMKFSSLVVLYITVTTTSAFAPVPSVGGRDGRIVAPEAKQHLPLFASAVGEGNGMNVYIQKTKLLNEIETRAASIEARTQALMEKIAAAENEQNQVQVQDGTTMSISTVDVAATVNTGSGGLSTMLVGGAAAAAGARTALQNRAEKQAELRRQAEERARERARAASAASNARFLIGPKKWPMGLVMAVPFFAFTNEVPSDVSLQYNLDITPTTTMTRSTNAIPTNYVERYTFEEELVRRVAVRENEPVISETSELQSANQLSIEHDGGSAIDAGTVLLATKQEETLNRDEWVMPTETDATILIAKATPSTTSDNAPLQFAQYAGGAVLLLIAAAAVSAREDYVFEDTDIADAKKLSSSPLPTSVKKEKKVSRMGSYFDLAVDVLDDLKSPRNPGSNGKNQMNNRKIIIAKKEVAPSMSVAPTVENESRSSDEAKPTELEPVTFLSSDTEEISTATKQSMAFSTPTDDEVVSSMLKFVSLFNNQTKVKPTLFNGEGEPAILLERRKKETENSNIRIRLNNFASQSQCRQTGTKSALFIRKSAGKEQGKPTSNVKVQLTKFATLLYESLPTACV